MTSKRLIEALIQFIPLIVLSTLVFGIVGGYYYYFMCDTQYTATTTFYVMDSETKNINDNNDNSNNINSASLSFYGMLAKDYSVLATSRSVTMTVSNNLGMNSLAGYGISISQQNETRVMKLTVSGTDPLKAVEIADETVKVFTEKVKATIGVENVNVIDYAYIQATGPNRMKNTSICAFAGMVIPVAIVVLKEFLDTTLRTVDDVEQVLEIPVLAQVNRIRSSSGKKTAKSKKEDGKSDEKQSEEKKSK